MTDDLIKKTYDKYIKNWFKKNYKFLLTILIYIFYQTNFLISILNDFNLNVTSLPRNLRLVALTINDLIYVISLIILFKKEIINGIKNFKKNFTNNTLLAVSCWLIGSVIMTVSSIIISLISGKDLSTNETLVRQSIIIAPFYMLFTCSIVAPILEEMVFRRSLYGIIKNKWLFVIISGASFGLLHVIGSYSSPFDLLYIIPYGSMGCAFAFLLTKTNNITLPIMIHMIHNFILVLMQILGK